MKQIEVRPGIIVLSPWHKIEEAAAYCGMSRSTFEAKAAAADLPRGGDGSNKRYRADDLDRFIANGFRFPGREPEGVAGSNGRRRQGREASKAPESGGVVNPYTGRINGGRG